MKKGTIWLDNNRDIVSDIYSVKRQTAKGNIVTTENLKKSGMEFYTRTLPEVFTLSLLNRIVSPNTISTFHLN